MPLRDHLLTPKEIGCLDRVCEQIAEDPEIRSWVRRNFKTFLENVGHPLKTHEITRALPILKEQSEERKAKINTGAYERRVLLYDFFTNDLRKYMQGMSERNSAYSDILREIKILKGIRKEKIEMSDTVYEQIREIVGPDNLLQEIPDEFVGEFFGYRRGSRVAEIITFHIKIMRDRNNEKYVTFVNEYIRNLIKWKVTGSGMFVNNTLYLWGHALNWETVSTDIGSISLGMRFFALRNVPGRPITYGVLISMDEAQSPIAARLLLVPKRLHRLEAALTNLDDEALINEMISEKEDDAVRQERMVERIGEQFRESDDYVPERDKEKAEARF